MNPYEELDRLARTAKTLEDSARVLSDLLTGGFSVWTDGRLYNIRQLVARVKGLQIHVYANDHSPPHFHVKSPDIDALFKIEDGVFIRGNIDGREQKLVQWWHERSKTQLIDAWNATRPSTCHSGPITQ